MYIIPPCQMAIKRIPSHCAPNGRRVDTQQPLCVKLYSKVCYKKVNNFQRSCLYFLCHCPPITARKQRNAGPVTLEDPRFIRSV